MDGASILSNDHVCILRFKILPLSRTAEVKTNARPQQNANSETRRSFSKAKHFLCTLYLALLNKGGKKKKKEKVSLAVGEHPALSAPHNRSCFRHRRAYGGEEKHFIVPGVRRRGHRWCALIRGSYEWDERRGSRVLELEMKGGSK